MAEEIIYNVEVNSKEAESNIESINSSLKGVSEKANSTGKDIEGIGEAAKKSGKDGKKGLGLFSKGVKGIGLAIKSAGLGILLSVMGSIFAVMRKNQSVLDAIETATNFIAVGFKAVSEAVTSAYNSVSESTDGFDALGKVITSLLTLAITPLKLSFYQLKLAMELLKVGYETMFGDDKSIQEAKKGVEETKLAIMEVVGTALEAGKSVIDNIGEAIDEVSQGTSALIDNLSKIDPKELLKTAKGMTELGNAAEIAAAKQAQLVEEYDRQAESQRQIRDDESLSIEARKKANDELGKILKKQEEAMLKQADLQEASAQAQYDANQNQENYIALIDAETNRKGVLAQINGFISEQKVNAIALLKEEREIINSLGESESQLAIQRQKFSAEQILIEQDRLNALIEINELEGEIEAERLHAIVENANAGTQAKIDAQIVLDEFLNTNAEENVQLKKDLGLQQVADAKAVADAEVAIRQGNLNNIGASFALISQLAGKNKALQAAALIGESAVGIAKTVINTQAANSAAVLKYALLPGGIALAAAERTINNIGAGVSIATNIAATSKGLSQLGGGSKGLGALSSVNSGGGGSSTPSAPTFNVVGQSSGNVGTQTETAAQQSEANNSQPVRAYVVSTEMTSQQQLDRDTEEQSSIG